MDNETFHACQLAIRERIKAIDLLRNSPQSDRAGLIQMGFALRLLARRYIKAAEWPGHEVTDDVRLGWEFEWYMNYIKAIVQICKTAQIAVREKRLTLRNQLTRTPLFIADLEAWLNMDIDAALKAEANEFFPGVLNLHPAFDAWPDVLCIPPGAAYVQDIATWAAGDGLASVDDALSLLTGAAPAQTAAPPAPMEAVGASDDVEPDKAGPVPVEQGLLTKDIAVCFGDCYYSADNWPKRLSGTAWLETARIERGEIGGASAVWNPLTLAQLMHRQTKGDKAKEKLMKTLNSRFTRNPALGLWRAAFNEYFATYCTTD